MYTKFFRLAQAPFSISPDPRYLFMSERHREALAHLLYGVDAGGGIVLLTGDIGTGKTTICRCFLEQVPRNCNVAYIFNPKLSVIELLQSVCEEFHIEPAHQGAASVKDYIDTLNRFLLAAHAEGRNNVLVIDEAQNLSADVLEQLRLLTNLETNERKLLQIILIGQPELRTMLARPELEQLAQRVIAHYHLTALSENETASYIQHRMTTAGLTTASPFQPALVKHIHRLTAGVPRRINLLCDRALLGAYARGAQQIDKSMVEEAASELFINQRVQARRVKTGRFPAAALALLLAGVALGGAWALGGDVLKDTMLARFTSSEAVRTESAASPANTGEQVATANKAAPEPANELGAENPAPAATPEQAAAPTTAPARVELIIPEKNQVARAGIRNEADALRQLASRWGLSPQDGEPCEVVQKNDVLCHRSNGGLGELRQLDRPAVLKLYDQANKPFYALLTGLDANRAQLHAGSTEQEVAVPALTRHFRGEFVTLWRAPPGFDKAVETGDKGADADWFATQLAKLNGTKPPAAALPFGPKTIRQVRHFQQAQGLFVDGIIGPVTAMHINRASGVDEPKLQSQAPASNSTASRE